MNRLIASLENQKDLEQLASEGNSGSGRQKRLTVDFMGMQVCQNYEFHSCLDFYNNYELYSIRHFIKFSFIF